MTDRVNSLTVVLDHDIRADDIADLQRAIGMMRHVTEVGLNIADGSGFISDARARQDWSVLLLQIVHASYHSERFKCLKQAVRSIAEEREK